jgi:hypothetical protein
MRPPYFIDCVEAAPGVWCHPSEAAKVAAAQPSIADQNAATRPHTIADVPDLGSPADFIGILVGLVIVALIFGG